MRAPIAAATGSSMRCTGLRAPANSAASCTAWRPSSVAREGTQTTTRGLHHRRSRTRRRKTRSIFSHAERLATVPSSNGQSTSRWPGVRPSICFAAAPTATIPPSWRLSAMADGSSTRTPRPHTYVTVLAVPRSTATPRPMLSSPFDPKGLGSRSRRPSGTARRGAISSRAARGRRRWNPGWRSFDMALASIWRIRSRERSNAHRLDRACGTPRSRGRSARSGLRARGVSGTSSLAISPGRSAAAAASKGEAASGSETMSASSPSPSSESGTESDTGVVARAMIAASTCCGTPSSAATSACVGVRRSWDSRAG